MTTELRVRLCLYEISNRSHLILVGLVRDMVGFHISKTDVNFITLQLTSALRSL